MAGLVAFVAYVYVILRAYYVPPFCDEVISFFEFIRSGDMQPFYARTDANNHVINSALSRVFYLLFGDGIFVLRIANLLAFGLYLSYLFKFKSFFKNQWVWLAWFAAMVVPQYFLDFFHLSRGYGLSMAFLMATCYHLISFDKKAGMLHFGLACLWISLAVWSNLSLTLTAALVGLWLAYSWLIKQRSALSVSSHLVYLLLFAAFFVLPLAYAVLFGFELKNAGMLYYGADKGFWDKSIIMTAKWIADDWILGGVLVINSLFAYLFLVGYNFKNRKEASFMGLHLLFWGTIAGIVLMHHLLGVKYPVDRSTNHLFLMFFTVLLFEIDRSENGKARYAGFALAGFLMFNTLADANLSRTRLWEAEHVPKDFYDEMLAWKNLHGYSPIVSSHPLHQVVLKYHDYLNHAELELEDEPLFLNPMAEFMVARLDEHWSNEADFDTLYFDPESRTGLLRLRHEPRWTVRDSVLNAKPTSSEGFCNLASFKADSFRGKPITLIMEFEAISPEQIKDWQLVYSISDKAGNRLAYHQFGLHSTHPNIRDGVSIRARCLINEVPIEASDILVFSWNVRVVPMEISHAKVRLHTIKE